MTYEMKYINNELQKMKKNEVQSLLLNNLLPRCFITQ